MLERSSSLAHVIDHLGSARWGSHLKASAFFEPGLSGGLSDKHALGKQRRVAAAFVRQESSAISLTPPSSKEVHACLRMRAGAMYAFPYV